MSFFAGTSTPAAAETSKHAVTVWDWAGWGLVLVGGAAIAIYVGRRES